MKKLLLIAILMLALVFTVVACTTDEPAVTTDGETTAAPVPETTAEPDDDTTAAPETTEAPETTAAPETTEEVTTEEETTEEVTTADPSLPVNLFDAEALKPAAPMNITSAEIVDGVLHVVPSNADPYWTAFGKVDGARYVAIRYRSDATGADIQFYLASTGDGPVDDSTMLRQPIIADGEWHLIVIDTQPLIDAGKYDGKFVSYFRFDPLEAGYILDENGEPYKPDGQNYARYELPEGSSIDVDYIGFFNSVEYAEDWDYNYVNAPLAMGDAAYLAGQAASGNNMAAGEVTTEYDRTFVRLTTTGGDPYFQILSNANLKANFLAISYRTNSTTDGQIFVGSGGGPSGAGDCPNVAWNEDGNWNLVVIDLAATEGLTSITDGIVNYLRLDFFTGAGAEGDYFDVEYVAFFKSVAAAETYYNDNHAKYGDVEQAGKVAHSFDTFFVNDVMYFEQDGGAGDKLTAQDNTVAFSKAQSTMSLRGWIGFDQPIAAFGYFIDDGEMVFGEFTQATEDAVISIAGEHATRFKVDADISGLTEGTHTVGYVVKLADGGVVLLREQIKVVLPSDITDTFTSNVTSNAVDTTIDATDLKDFFQFGLNLGDYKTTDSAYKINGISEMFTDVNGKYAFTVGIQATPSVGAAFVRGYRAVNSVDLPATEGDLYVINNYYETDGNGFHGGAGIFSTLADGNLYILIKKYDAECKTHVSNFICSVGDMPNSGNLTMADDGTNVYILVDGVLYATVALSGETSYEKIATEGLVFAKTATVTLKDGTVHTIEDTLVAATCNAQVGFAVRGGDAYLTALKLEAFSAIELPVEPEAPAMPEEFTLSMYQAKLEKELYFTGAMDGYYLAVSENAEDAVTMYGEAVEGGYRMYFLDGETKKYVEIYDRGNNKAGVQIVDEATMAYVWNEEVSTWTVTYGENDFYLGTYGDFTTISSSSTFYITGENAANVGVSQYVATWNAVEAAE